MSRETTIYELRQAGEEYYQPKDRDLITPDLAVQQTLSDIAETCNRRTTRQLFGTTAELANALWVTRVEDISCIPRTNIAAFSTDRLLYLKDKVYFLTLENIKGEKTRIIGVMVEPYEHSDKSYSGMLTIGRCLDPDTNEIGICSYHVDNEKDTKKAIADFIWKDDNQLLKGGPGDINELKRGIYNTFSELLPPSMPIDTQPPVS